MLGRITAISVGAALLWSLPATAQQPRPHEHFQNAEIFYGWVSNSRGDKLRTFITRPKNSSGKVPVLFFVGWLSCDSVEYPAGETDGFGALILRLIDHSGYATARTEKPGVGESQGTTCDKSDFQGELEGYQAAFDSMAKYEFLDQGRVIVIGLSNGGGIMSRADASAIADTVNRVHPGRARYVEVDDMTHGFTIDKKFDADVVSTILNWAKDQMTAGK